MSNHELSEENKSAKLQLAQSKCSEFSEIDLGSKQSPKIVTKWQCCNCTKTNCVKSILEKKLIQLKKSLKKVISNKRCLVLQLQKNSMLKTILAMFYSLKKLYCYNCNHCENGRDEDLYKEIKHQNEQPQLKRKRSEQLCNN